MKIALLGSAPSSRLLAPFNDPEWDIWACSPPNYDLPRVDAFFELHLLERKMAEPKNKPYIDRIKSHPRTYIAFPHPQFPNAIVFPWQEYVEKYGQDFFSSSLSWMIAHAIEMKPEKIGIWGVDLSAQEEYSQQRPGLKFFIREARKLGIQVYAPWQSDIMFPSPLYGIKEHSPMWLKQETRRQELTQRFNEAHAAKDNAEKDMLILQGALGDLQFTGNTYCPTRFLEVDDGKEQDGPGSEGPLQSGSYAVWPKPR